MSLAVAPAGPSARKRGPPAPLNLAPSAPSSSVVVVDAEENGPTLPRDSSELPHGPISPSSGAAPQPQASAPAPGPRSRNVKRLSLSLSNSSQTSLPSSPAPAATAHVISSVPQHRRASVASQPAASISSVLRRNDEGDASTAAYADGPIEILPGIWLGAEDNARDWKGLVTRGIKSILNVAKEVASPFDSQHAPIRNMPSTPNLASAPRDSNTYQPAHLPSGRPPMHYLKLSWSHGQADLVRGGFSEAMKFVDDARARDEGVLIHCQCGVSRSATLVIALVMRAAVHGGEGVPPEVLALRDSGMQGAYDYVQQKSKTIGPNMSLIYQLLDYERFLKGDNSPSLSSVGATDDEEWERRRRQLDSPDQESREIMMEAKELDREMEERRARKMSQASTSSNTSFTGAIGNGAPWRVRYGAGGFSRSRATSVESSYTSRSSISVLSEDPLEEQDEDEYNRPDPAKATTPDTEATDEDSHQFITHKSPSPASRLSARKDRFVAPSAPATKTSFTLLPVPPSASPFQKSFNLPPGVTPHVGHRQPRLRPQPLSLKRTEEKVEETSVTPLSLPKRDQPKKEKRRPPPLKSLTAEVPFPSVHVVPETPDLKPRQSSLSSTSSSIASSSVSKTSSSISAKSRLSSKLSSFVPFPIKNALSNISTYSTSSRKSTGSLSTTATPAATQTLFIFPPSPRKGGMTTPSTLTLSSTPWTATTQTPRAGIYRQRTDTRKSWIGLSAVTPTTATARVDAQGFFGVP